MGFLHIEQLIVHESHVKAELRKYPVVHVIQDVGLLHVEQLRSHKSHVEAELRKNPVVHIIQDV